MASSVDVGRFFSASLRLWLFGCAANQKSWTLGFNAWSFLCQKLVYFFPVFILLLFSQSFSAKTKGQFEFPGYSSCGLISHVKVRVFSLFWFACTTAWRLCSDISPVSYIRKSKGWIIGSKMAYKQASYIFICIKKKLPEKVTDDSQTKRVG